MNKKMHHLLTSLPLLQGVSASDIAQILSNVKYSEHHIKAGMTFIRQDNICQHLTFLIEGSMRCNTLSRDAKYTFSEYLEATMVIEPDILYGIQRQHASTYTALSDCFFLTLPKNDVNRMMADIEVFRFNYLNLLSTLAIRRREATMPIPNTNLRSRIIRFMANHATTPFGRKKFTIRMSDMGNYLDVSRVLVSNVVHELNDEGLIKMGRGTIEIPALEALINNQAT